MGTQSRTTSTYLWRLRTKNVAPDGAACALLSKVTTSEKLEKAQAIIGHSGREKQKIVMVLSFSKTPFLKCFSSTPKRKAGILEFLRFEECFYVTD